MPLRARIGDTNVNAFDFDDINWVALKKTYKADKPLMPCCGRLAVPKTSKLDNFFFAHSRRGECTTAPESPEHIYLKTLVARTAKAAGWSVLTEARGQTPDGDDWVADVLCERGAAKVALEIQLAYQTETELRARQKTYRASGIRAAWFVGNKHFKNGRLVPSKELPLFNLLPFRAPHDPEVSGFGLPLPAFVTALLTKKIAWKTIPHIYRVEYMVDTCWKCSTAVKQVVGWAVDVYLDTGKTVPNMSTVLESMMESVSNSVLTKNGLNAIGKFETLKGNAPGFPFCNVCVRCGAPQSNRYIMKKRAERITVESGKTRAKHAEGYIEIPRVDDSAGRWHYQDKPTRSTRTNSA